MGRETVHRISVQNSHLESTNELLLCDTVYKSFRDAGPSHVWPNLRSLHLSNNVIKVKHFSCHQISIPKLSLPFQHLKLVSISQIGTISS